MEIRNSTLKIVLHAFKPLCACIFTLASSHLISRKYTVYLIKNIRVYSSHVIKNNTHFHKLKNNYQDLCDMVICAL